jgi:hypothetical protein
MPDLHRTNINLYASDVAYFQRTYGHGWTEKVRDIIHKYVTEPISVNIDEPYTKPENSKLLFSELDDLIKEQSDE